MSQLSAKGDAVRGRAASAAGPLSTQLPAAALREQLAEATGEIEQLRTQLREERRERVQAEREKEIAQHELLQAKMQMAEVVAQCQKDAVKTAVRKMMQQKERLMSECREIVDTVTEERDVAIYDEGRLLDVVESVSAALEEEFGVAQIADARTQARVVADIQAKSTGSGAQSKVQVALRTAEAALAVIPKVYAMVTAPEVAEIAAGASVNAVVASATAFRRGAGDDDEDNDDDEDDEEEEEEEEEEENGEADNEAEGEEEYEDGQNHDPDYFGVIGGGDVAVDDGAGMEDGDVEEEEYDDEDGLDDDNSVLDALAAQEGELAADSILEYEEGDDDEELG